MLRAGARRPRASPRVALALAQRFDGEIVSVDSAQVYRGMDVGTAKPDAATRAAIAAPSLDVIDPDEAYSAARFRRDALQAIAAIRRRGRVPIVAGGTMLYFKALREGLSRLPQADADVRAALDARAARDGWPALHAELARVDPATAARLAPFDAQRIQRALEVHALTGTAAVGAAGRARSRRRHRPDASPSRSRRPTARRCTRRSRAASTRCSPPGSSTKCDSCASAIVDRRGLPSMRCVGYRQALDYLDGGIDAGALRERGIAATRQLAKRQLTWLRSMDVAPFDCFAGDVIDSVVARVARRHRRGCGQAASALNAT